MGQLYDEFAQSVCKVFERCAEEEYESNGYRKIMEKVVEDSRYWGIVMETKYDEANNIVYFYLTVPKNSQLLEEFEGVCTPMCGEVAAKIMKQRLLDYFKFTDSIVNVKYKINPYRELWTLEDADKALENYKKACAEYNRRRANGEDI